MKNLKQHFYREYYRAFDPRAALRDDRVGERIVTHNEDKLKEATAALYEFRADAGLQRARFPEALFPKAAGYHRLQLQTTYPGFLTGTGYNHETKTKHEVSIGFHFDHTFGLPTLPGSGVKGALRAPFPRRDQPRTTESAAVKNAKADFILTLLRHYGVGVAADDRAFVDALEANLFEGGYRPAAGIPPDAFLEAVIVAPAEQNRVVGPDVITPHGFDPLKEPTPLPLLKVLPGVTWEFTFRLFPVEINGIMVSAEQKGKLLRALLLLFGVGAKTNVGYGQLADPEARLDEFEFLESDIEPADTSRPAGTSTEGAEQPSTPAEELPVFDYSDKWFPASKLQNPKRPPKDKIYALVLKKLNDRSVKVQLLIGGRGKKPPVTTELNSFLSPPPSSGQWIEVQIDSFSGTGINAENFRLKNNLFTVVGKNK